MQVITTNIADVKLLEPRVFNDERGFFMETFREDWFRNNVADVTFVQDNHSKSAQGILRGLHFQLFKPQGKLVRVVSGEIFDVAVDLRRSSPTFGHWVAEKLSAENKRQMWVPAGFAHGFYVISETAEVVYRCTDYYSPEFERSLRWNDAELAIDWPLINSIQPCLSAKDREAGSFASAEFYD